MLVRILEFENRIFGKPLEFSVRTICFKGQISLLKTQFQPKPISSFRLSIFNNAKSRFHFGNDFSLATDFQFRVDVFRKRGNFYIFSAVHDVFFGGGKLLFLVDHKHFVAFENSAVFVDGNIVRG